MYSSMLGKHTRGAEESDDGGRIASGSNVTLEDVPRRVNELQVGCKYALNKLYRDLIVNVLRPHWYGTVLSMRLASKERLLAIVDSMGDDDVRELISTVDRGVKEGTLKARRVDSEANAGYQRTRRKQASDHRPCLLVKEVEWEEQKKRRIESVEDNIPSYKFMEPPTAEVQKRCIAEYRERTGNAMLAMSICVVCAREMFTREGKYSKVGEIPNRHLLTPFVAHPAQKLSEGGIILHPRSYLDTEEVFRCNECSNRLVHGSLPRLALANNMWTGDTPEELKYLSQPEKILIALYVPVAYIYKLYPKGGSKGWLSNKLHRGLRGNVSTYWLDQQKISDMVTVTMPNSPAILASTIGVSFVGPTNKTEKWIERGLPSNFIVRRGRVAKALEWLKANNPLWASTTISLERLAQLPEHGVPNEILETVRVSEDTAALATEQASYVPADNEEENTDESIIEKDDEVNENDGVESDEEFGVQSDIDEEDYEDDDVGVVNEDVIPIQALGVVDVAGTSVTDSEILAHALHNATVPDGNKSENYAIRRGSAFINEYSRVDDDTGMRNDGGPSNPSHLLGAFPCRFPYGLGGFEMHRPEPVSYESHAKWAMQHGDKDFRKDMQFMFQVFGVSQKRKICKAAVLQMATKSYDRNINLIQNLTVDDLQRASVEESQQKGFSNPAVRALRGELKAIRAKVPASDEARTSVRSKIWGMTTLYNPANLWITINPSDTQNPIAQVFAREEIDLDKFEKTAGPDADKRATNMADDPYASAKFFNYTIQAILETLIGVKKTSAGLIKRTEGILGLVRGYVGTVEAQGRGSLHLHMLVWLKDSLAPEETRKALETSEFREKMTKYIGEVILADIEGKSTEEIKAMPKEKEIGYSRPLDPLDSSFDEEYRKRNISFARSMQLHQCKNNVCLVHRKGKLKCKRRAPWQTSRRAWVKETGEWGPKRTSSLMNNWNPNIAHCVMCNHDAKLITSGALTQKLTWYITHYATKKQKNSSNLSALLAKRLAFHRKESKFSKNSVENNRKLLQACANTLSRDREISAPEVVSHLMGWGDVVLSHHYVTIHWDFAMNLIYKAYPELRQSHGTAQSNEAPTDLAETENTQKTSEILTISGGNVTRREFYSDYRYRGEAIKGLSVLRFFLDTYEKRKEQAKESREVQTRSKAGRPLHMRVDYLPEANKPDKCRVFRSEEHETVPRFVGRWFPRSDREESKEVHAAAMLFLLKPWRSLADLKGNHESLQSAYIEFLAEQGEDRTVKNIIENIQYYYDCADDASDEQVNDDMETDPDLNEEDEGVALIQDHIEEDITEEDVKRALFEATPARARQFASCAIDIANNVGIFSQSCAEKTVSANEGEARRGTEKDTDLAYKWDVLFKNSRKGKTETLSATVNGAREGREDVNEQRSTHEPELDNISSRVPGVMALQDEQVDKTCNTRSLLFEDQLRALEIIEDHVHAFLRGENPPQLLKQVQGRGGTGKSLLIKAITEFFDSLRISHLLSKSATSGIAGTHIGGTTVHGWAGIPVNKREQNTSDEVHERRRRNLAEREYAIIDEVSMMDKEMLCKVSDAALEARCRNGNGKADLPFGGLNVILFGDFHQLPPVGNPLGALYVPSLSSDSTISMRGKAIYDQFNTVVILKRQVRCTDPTWDSILGRLREGECTSEDAATIRKLILREDNDNVPDFNEPPWNESILITSRHAVRREWNAKAVERHCQSVNSTKYVIPSNDIDMGTMKKPSNKVRLELAKREDENAQRKLDGQIEIAKGMKAMVMDNISPALGLANGSRGTIEDIILDPREPAITAVNGVATLEYMPTAVLFRPTTASSTKFPGVENGIIPIRPSVATYKVSTIPNKGKKKKAKRQPGQQRKKEPGVHSVRRTQYALTPAYAFTDYKSQGQTIEHVVVDIARPTTGAALTPFAIYVALSRSRGRDTIRLLRDFDDSVLRQHPSEYLRLEMQRLVSIDQETKVKHASSKI